MPSNSATTMGLDFPLEYLIEHLTHNHDEDWRFEIIELSGMALNCYLPTDLLNSETETETFIVIDACLYQILEVGKNVPEALKTEIQNILDEASQIGRAHV